MQKWEMWVVSVELNVQGTNDWNIYELIEDFAGARGARGGVDIVWEHRGEI